MQHRRFFLGLASAGLALLTLGGTGRADTIDGTNAVANLGALTLNDPSLGAATSFTFSALLSAVGAGSQTGDFATYVNSIEVLGSATFDLTDVTTFTFGNATFGTFTGASYTELTPSANSRTFYVLGSFDPGTAFPGTIQDTGPASYVFSVVQGTGGGYSSSGVLSSPPAPLIPEPASIALAGTAAIAGLGLATRRRVRRA